MGISSELIKHPIILKSFSGNDVNLMGTVHLKLEISDKTIWHEFQVIEKAPYPVILGIDVKEKLAPIFLRLDNGPVHILDEDANLPRSKPSKQSEPEKSTSQVHIATTYPIVWAEDIELQPHTISRIPARIKTEDEELQQKIENMNFVFQPVQKQPEEGILLAARTIARATNGTIPVLLANLNRTTVRMSKGQRIGYVESMQQFKEVLNLETSSERTQITQVD